MPRFFKPDIENDPVLSGSDAAHIAQSLRMKAGDPVTVCDGEGTDYFCTISSVGKGAIDLLINEKRKSVSEPRLRLTLFMCLAKGDKPDTIVRQAVELGATEIVPVISARSVSRPAAEAMKKKIARWQRIADEAAGQSGRGILPRVSECLSLSDCAARLRDFDAALFMYESGGEPLSQKMLENARTAAVITGPEGGFSPEEAALIAASGAHTVTLGPRILRAETAPAAAIACVMLLSGNLK